MDIETPSGRHRTTIIKSPLKLKKEILFIILACLLTRLPQIFSENLFLDGDEAIVGLMAKHFSEGTELPFYFYGQTYGFSFLEVLPLSISFLVFGVSDLTLKLTMLLLWTVGVLLFYLTLKQFKSDNKWLPLLVTLVLVAVPAWAVWSMKARGGYISAFVLFPLITYLLFHEKSEKAGWIHVLVGFILVTLYETQPLWVPGVGLFLLYRHFQLRSVKLAAFQLVGAGAGLGMFQVLRQLDTRLAGFHSPRIFDMPDNLAERIIEIPNYIYTNFTGSYYLGGTIAIDSITSVVAWLMTGVFFVLIALSVYTLAKRNWNNSLLMVSGMAAVGSVVVILFLISYSARYLIPLTGFVVFMLYFGLRTLSKHKIVNGGLIALIIVSCFSLTSFKDYKFENGNKRQIKRLIRTLKSKNANYVFCQGGLLQWQIMFYSNEEVLARYHYNTDRYLPYVEQVNEALAKGPENVALVGPYNPNLPKGAPNLNTYGTQYYSYLYPTKEALAGAGFRFD